MGRPQRMVKASCTVRGAQKVRARFDGTTDKHKCAAGESYYAVSFGSDDHRNFVVCLGEP